MKIFTKNPVQVAGRVMLFAWLSYVMFGICKFVYQAIPLEPSSIYMGFEINPSYYYYVSVMHIILTILFVLVITVCPALFIWARVEDKFWPADTNRH
jgi:hypothetical protein